MTLIVVRHHVSTARNKRPQKVGLPHCSNNQSVQTQKIQKNAQNKKKVQNEQLRTTQHTEKKKKLENPMNPLVRLDK